MYPSSKVQECGSRQDLCSLLERGLVQGHHGSGEETIVSTVAAEAVEEAKKRDWRQVVESADGGQEEMAVVTVAAAEGECCRGEERGGRASVICKPAVKRMRISWPTGEKYEGEVVKGEMHGKGRYWTTPAVGLLYAGEFRNHMPNGWMVVRKVHGAHEVTFAGYMKDGDPHGPCMWMDTASDATSSSSPFAAAEEALDTRGGVPLICFGNSVEKETVGWCLGYVAPAAAGGAAATATATATAAPTLIGSGGGGGGGVGHIILRKCVPPCLEVGSRQGLRRSRPREWRMTRFSTGDVSEGEFFLDDEHTRYNGIGAYYMHKKRMMVIGRYRNGRMHGPVICYDFVNLRRLLGTANGNSLHHYGVMSLAIATPMSEQLRLVAEPYEAQYRSHVYLERLYFMKRDRCRQELRQQSMFGPFLGHVFTSHVM